MNKLKTLGLVGGLGVGATVHYYKKLAEEFGPALDIVITHAHPSRVYEFVQAQDRSGLAEYLVGFLHRLHAAGAEVAAIPAVTPHFGFQELVAISPLPLFDIFEPLIQELAARHISKIAVFGTRYVIESRLYGRLGPIEILVPAQREVDYIHGIYSELADKGYGAQKQFDGLTEMANTLIAREGVQAVV